MRNILCVGLVSSVMSGTAWAYDPCEHYDFTVFFGSNINATWSACHSDNTQGCDIWKAHVRIHELKPGAPFGSTCAANSVTMGIWCTAVRSKDCGTLMFL